MNFGFFNRINKHSAVCQRIMNNNEKNIDNVDISQILSKEEQELLKKKHLISCFKTKLFEYKNLIDKKDVEISKIRKSSRINKLVKLENDNASISLENMNLSIEKNKLNNKISNLEIIMDCLNNQCNKNVKKTSIRFSGGVRFAKDQICRKNRNYR